MSRDRRYLRSIRLNGEKIIVLHSSDNDYLPTVKEYRSGTTKFAKLLTFALKNANMIVTFPDGMKFQFDGIVMKPPTVIRNTAPCFVIGDEEFISQCFEWAEDMVRGLHSGKIKS